MDFNQRADAIIAQIRADHLAAMAAINETRLPFNRDYFMSVLQDISKASAAGSGCSYELYAMKVSSAISHYAATLPHQICSHVIELARERFDYLDPAQLEEMQEELRDSDKWCQHGIELGCCPAGCGSY